MQTAQAASGDSLDDEIEGMGSAGKDALHRSSATLRAIRPIHRRHPVHGGWRSFRRPSAEVNRLDAVR